MMWWAKREAHHQGFRPLDAFAHLEWDSDHLHAQEEETRLTLDVQERKWPTTLAMDSGQRKVHFPMPIQRIDDLPQ